MISRFEALVHDRMTEMTYPESLASFDPGVIPTPSFTIPLMAEGRAALERVRRMTNVLSIIMHLFNLLLVLSRSVQRQDMALMKQISTIIPTSLWKSSSEIQRTLRYSILHSRTASIHGIGFSAGALV